jgi:hypothetical protein
MKGENELVTAAKQQAVEALKIAEEAERFAREEVPRSLSSFIFFALSPSPPFFCCNFSCFRVVG